ncbi:unnamed protein product [Parascedosporium putredinis]|uniref:Uncharacterized protein n=1 Tax=Parascedosporium putredinis TaxID=1442378 RepID=A0A9P1H9B0_9PEZI|nr:unnamed protein product [Parascedosporium putredinis]CAI8001487.1 unnamed protein product [Parascedosporium putredinis]
MPEEYEIFDARFSAAQAAENELRGYSFARYRSQDACPHTGDESDGRAYYTPIKQGGADECIETAPMMQVRLVGFEVRSPTPPPRKSAARIGSFAWQLSKPSIEGGCGLPKLLQSQIPTVGYSQGLVGQRGVPSRDGELEDQQRRGAQNEADQTTAETPSTPLKSVGQLATVSPFYSGPTHSSVAALQTQFSRGTGSLAYQGVQDHQSQSTQTGASKELRALLNNLNRDSSLSMVLDAQYFPFTETAAQNIGDGPHESGVVKITNIPFETAHNEIDAFLGQNSRYLSHLMESIHIVMCRVTGKTLDAFVELRSTNDAVRVVERHMRCCASGRPSRLGDRLVDISMSNQKELMKALFPKANGVEWTDDEPIISKEGMLSFRGFVTEEELTMLVKHVENPHRCPFSRDCPERPFESIISMLQKFPWGQTHHIRNGERYKIFRTTFKLIELLQTKIQRRTHDARLTSRLLRRLVVTSMTCRGFTRQRAEDIGQQTDDYWGYFWLEVGVIPPEELEKLTLFQLAEREFQAIEKILRRAAGKLSYTVQK